MRKTCSIHAAPQLPCGCCHARCVCHEHRREGQEDYTVSALVAFIALTSFLASAFVVCGLASGSL